MVILLNRPQPLTKMNKFYLTWKIRHGNSSIIVLPEEINLISYTIILTTRIKEITIENEMKRKIKINTPEREEEKKENRKSRINIINNPQSITK